MERDLKCMYCAEMGITNTDVFIEIVDVELGAGWICKECFIESEKEKDEHLKELEEELQAKEQECEEKSWEIGNLGYKIKNQRKEINIRLKQLDQLKAENEDLQEQIRKHNDDMFKNAPEKRFYCKGCTLPYISKKLKQTLAEIKEIAEKSCCLQATSTCEEYENCNECSRTSDDVTVKQILQKISEVEDEN